jgi:hypothetical protein
MSRVAPEIVGESALWLDSPLLLVQDRSPAFGVGSFAC